MIQRPGDLVYLPPPSQITVINALLWDARTAPGTLLRMAGKRLLPIVIAWSMVAVLAVGAGAGERVPARTWIDLVQQEAHWYAAIVAACATILILSDVVHRWRSSCRKARRYRTAAAALGVDIASLDRDDALATLNSAVLRRRPEIRA